MKTFAEDYIIEAFERSTPFKITPYSINLGFFKTAKALSFKSATKLTLMWNELNVRQFYLFSKYFPLVFYVLAG